MASVNTCFENIIGLSRTDCECVEDRPVGAGTSDSDLTGVLQFVCGIAP